MKINLPAIRSTQRQRQRGSAVLVVIILLGIMTTLVVANSRTLYYLHRDLELIDKQQQRKFETPMTNRTPTTPTSPKPIGKDGPKP